MEFWIQWATLALILAVPFAYAGSKPNFWAWAGVITYTVSYFIANSYHVAYWLLEPPMAHGLALRIYTLHGMVLTTLFCGIVWLLLTIKGLPRPDLQAKLVWTILLVAEGFAVLEYLGCKVVVDPFGSGDLLLSQIWGIEVSRYACGRALGTISPYIAPIITTLYLLGLQWARRGHVRQG